MQQVASGGWSTDRVVTIFQVQRVGKNVRNAQCYANGTQRCVGNVGGDNPVSASVIVGDHWGQDDGPELDGRVKNELSERIKKTRERHFPDTIGWIG